VRDVLHLTHSYTLWNLNFLWRWLKTTDFWDITALVGTYTPVSLRTLLCFDVQAAAAQEVLDHWIWTWRHCDPSKCYELFTQWHSVTSQKTWIFRFFPICLLVAFVSNPRHAGLETGFAKGPSAVWVLYVAICWRQQNDCLTYVWYSEHQSRTFLHMVIINFQTWNVSKLVITS
jgi:hypothetical protein